ncbi:hypothetical protein CR513_43143, partial [Mucuna pruriens]
ERSDEQARLTEEAMKRQKEAEKHHENELNTEGCPDPHPPRVTWGLLFSEQIDGTPIPSQFKELVIDSFDDSQDPRVHL